MAYDKALAKEEVESGLEVSDRDVPGAMADEIRLWKAFDPHQPRIPKGQPGGGRWTSHSRPIHLTGKELSDSEDFQTLRRLAEEYGRQRLAGRTYVNRATGRGIQVTAAGIRKVTSGGRLHVPKLQSVVAIPSLIERGQHIGSEPDRKGRNTIKAIHFFIAPIKIGERTYDARLVVRETTNGDFYYDHNLTRIEPAGVSEEARISHSQPPAAGSNRESIRKSTSFVKGRHRATFMARWQPEIRVHGPMAARNPRSWPDGSPKSAFMARWQPEIREPDPPTCPYARHHASRSWRGGSAKSAWRSTEPI